MAEVLAVTGGVAGFAQILHYILKASGVLTNICHEVKDAPCAVRQIRDRLNLLKATLETFQRFLTQGDVDAILEREVRQLLENSIRPVYDCTERLDHILQNSIGSGTVKKRNRIEWAFFIRRMAQKSLEELVDAENTLNRVIQILNFQISLLVCLSVRQSAERIDKIHERAQASRELSSLQNDVEILPSSPRNSLGRSLLTSKWQNETLGINSWLRKLGFYGSYTYVAKGNNFEKSRLSIGYKSPTWLVSKAIMLEVRFSKLQSLESGFRILPGYLRVQNQVPLCSPFMTACRAGDVQLIQQHLTEKTGFINDRTACSGRTPLLLAIQGNHINAVRCLLEAGADPNIGDDDQVLPVFAACGMKPRRNKFFPQLPPPETFITLLRLLTQYGASVHEIVHGRLLTTPNLYRSDFRCQTLEFFRLLIEENYTDFNAIDNLGWSALMSAIRTKGTAVEAIKLLINANVNISKLMPDGRCALHLASEMAGDVNVLKYLYACGPNSINRQDHSGFTPLHYCVLGGCQQNRPLTFEKTIFLLERGADPEIRGMNHEALGDDDEGVRAVTPFELSKILTRKFPCLDLESAFVDAMKAVGYIFSEGSFFVDAAEYVRDNQ